MTDDEFVKEFCSKCINRKGFDNVAKSILDALNGIVYVDDKQIIELNIEKIYAETSWTEVKIKEI